MIRFLQAAGTALVLFFASFSPSRGNAGWKHRQDIVFVFDASGKPGGGGVSDGARLYERHSPVRDR